MTNSEERDATERQSDKAVKEPSVGRFDNDVLMKVDPSAFEFSLPSSVLIPDWLRQPCESFVNSFQILEHLHLFPRHSAGMLALQELQQKAYFKATIENNLRKATGAEALDGGEVDDKLRDAAAQVNSDISGIPFRERILDFHARNLEHDLFERATQAMPPLMLVTLWTCVECLWKDVWVESANRFPRQLALTALNYRAPSKGQQLPKQFEPEVFAKYNFDFSVVMGTVLAEKYHFGSLEGISKAYQSTFGDNLGHQPYLDDIRLRRLQQVRNLIVHRAGRVDESFLRFWKEDIPLGDSFHVDATLLKDSVESVKESACQLLSAVARWAESLSNRTNADEEKGT